MSKSSSYLWPWLSKGLAGIKSWSPLEAGLEAVVEVAEEAGLLFATHASNSVRVEPSDDSGFVIMMQFLWLLSPSLFPTLLLPSEIYASSDEGGKLFRFFKFLVRSFVPSSLSSPLFPLVPADSHKLFDRVPLIE